MKKFLFVLMAFACLTTVTVANNGYTKTVSTEQKQVFAPPMAYENPAAIDIVIPFEMQTVFFETPCMEIVKPVCVVDFSIPLENPASIYLKPEALQNKRFTDFKAPVFYLGKYQAKWRCNYTPYNS